ncbi:MAG: hypothetical protein JWP25_7016 [Bradyrhizobium sp.]|nr:hypothetical protein [Bradyrhizobium sp.]
MANTDFDARDLAHISIDAWREAAHYGYPSRNQSRKPLRDNYVAHAQGLLDQLSNAVGLMPLPGADQRLAIDGLGAGVLVEVGTLMPAEGSRSKAAKIPTALDFPSQDIVVLRTSRNEDRTESAVLFIPDNARTFLEARIVAYGSENLGNQKRPDIDRFENIETIQAAAAESLFVGMVDFADGRPAWWELWVREAEGRADAVEHAARNGGFDVRPERLIFPDTVVLFVHARSDQILLFARRTPGAIAEIRRATGTIEPFLERGNLVVAQHDFVAELATRITPPAGEVPLVCILDTGVSSAHPLIAPGLQNAWAYDNEWLTDDHEPNGGHGTGLAGLVLYGDLEYAMNDRRQIVLNHAVESMKMLPPRGFPPNHPPSYGVITQGAVAAVEISRPGATRSFCIASSTADFSSARPSTWSGAIDQISAGSMPGDRINSPRATATPKRLVLVATGNIAGGERGAVTSPQPVEDPAQSWNALSIGGYTTKETLPVEQGRPLVAANHRSPYSRDSAMLPDDLTPIKPEVLFEAGNMAIDDSGFCSWHPALSLLSAGSDVEGEPLVPFWATSAAVGMSGNFFGRLAADLPGYWPETYRALAVQSAAWPQPIRARLVGRGAHWKTGTKAEKQKVLREVGYGVPNLDRAIKSARNDLNLIAQAEIQPFAIGADGRTAVFNEMHFYDLPWPRATLQALENAIVEMKVTLSYFVEPNLTGRAATRPDTYRSFGLRFDMKKRNETRVAFRHRVNASQAKDEVEAEGETSCWLLGPKSIQAGSLHCDIWRGHAVDLALHDAIAIYPVGGWWKSHVGQRRMTDRGRYALILSIAAPGQSVDLSTEVKVLVEARAAILVEG